MQQNSTAKGPSKASKGDEPREKLVRIEQELNAAFFERSEVSRGLMLALLARENVVLLGPPGSAKSELNRELCSRITDGDGPGEDGYFQVLLSRTSTPEDVFGPYSLKALENDSYRRKTSGMLPEARIAFVDEIFKANSAVLNGMLWILNERLFYNDGVALTVPLEMLVAASNELPEDREELEAVWDRFLLRYEVSYLVQDSSFEALLARGTSGPGAAAGPKATISLPELALAREAVASVDASGVASEVAGIRADLLEAGIRASDRRYAKSMALLKANAYLEGRDTVYEDDLEVLGSVLWDEPKHAREVKKTIYARVFTQLLKAQDLMDDGEEVLRGALGAPQETRINKGQEAYAKLKDIGDRLLDLTNEAAGAGRNPDRLRELSARNEEMKKEVLHKCMNLQI